MDSFLCTPYKHGWLDDVTDEYMHVVKQQTTDKLLSSLHVWIKGDLASEKKNVTLTQCPIKSVKMLLCCEVWQ